MLKIIIKNKNEYVSIEKNPYAKKGHRPNVKLWSKCPVCNSDVVNEKGKIVLLGKWNDKKHGIFILSDKFDDFKTEYPEQFDYNQNMSVEFICPHCKHSLMLDKQYNCAVCKSATVMLHVFSKSIIQFCSKSGCKEHQLFLHKDDTWDFMRQVYSDSMH